MSQRTALYEKHVALKAKMVDFAGWEMPIQYSSVKDEVIAVRQKVGVFDVSHMGEFFVEGPDAVRYLDHMVTADITNAPVGKAIYSPLCREDGTVVDDLIVYKLATERLLICVNASNIDKDFAWLSAKTAGFNIRLTNRSADYSLLALQGPLAETTLKAWIPVSSGQPYYSAWESSCLGGPVIIARTGYTGEDGFEIFGSHELIKNLWGRFMEHGVTPCGLAARDVLRLEVAYPLYGHELNDEVTPLDAALAWTVKKNKPSFVGQQALTQYKPRYKLIKLVLEKGIPREGYAVCNQEGETIGTVTSGTLSVTLNKGIALARVNAHQLPGDQKYFIDIRQKLYPATAVTQPFVQGGHK